MWMFGLFSALGIAHAQAQTQTRPPSLDDQLRSTLALGDADGCVQFLGVPANSQNRQEDVDDAIDALQVSRQIGNELAAICSPSAVASASAMGGALDTVQATKTVSQFRLVRRRIDNRLSQPSRQPPPAPQPPRRFQLLPQFELDRGTGTGVGVFGEFERQWKDRETSQFDLGYTSRINGFMGGVDYAWEGSVVGGWMGYSKTKGDFNPIVPLVASPGGTVDQNATNFLGNPQTLSRVCGDLSGGGSFDEGNFRLGGFAARSWGERGFVDGGLSYDRRNHSYARNVCTIEVQSSPLAFVSGVRFRDANANGQVDNGEINNANPQVNVLFVDGNNDGLLNVGESPNDDIYAGTISGDARINETAFSGRAGYDFQSGYVTFGPRVVFTHTSTTVNGYSETGRSSVANDVHPNALDPNEPDFTRQLGGPVGLEMVYDARSYRSDLLQLGGQVSFQVERSTVTLIPFGSAYLRQEFGSEFINTTVRMAQDLRTNPVRFSFSNNGPDRSTVELAGGMSLHFDNGLTAQAAVSKLLFDRFINATSLTGGVRWRF
jgi:uncharacterized protein YhjY with autotransporter beta-barrel domain